MADRQEWMVVGQVAGPFGVKGEIKIEPRTDFPDRFKELQQVFLGPDAAGFKVERSRRHGHQVVVKLQGIDSREDVFRLRNRDVMVPREEAIPLPVGHYYLEDLIGIDVVTVEGEGLGTVAEIIRTGGNDVYVVSGASKGEVLVPGTKDAVREVDIQGRRIVVESWILEDEA